MYRGSVIRQGSLLEYNCLQSGQAWVPVTIWQNRLLPLQEMWSPVKRKSALPPSFSQLMFTANHQRRKHRWPSRPLGAKGYVATCSCPLELRSRWTFYERSLLSGCFRYADVLKATSGFLYSPKHRQELKKKSHLLTRRKPRPEAIVHGRQDGERGFRLPACHLRRTNSQSQPALVLPAC